VRSSRRGSPHRARRSTLDLYDLVMLCLLGLLAFRGFRRGLVREVAGLAALAAGFLLAYSLDGPVGGWLRGAIHSLTSAEARILAFLVILLVVSIGVDLAARLFTRIIKRLPVVGSLNRLGGLLTGALLAFVGIWLLTACLLFLPASLLPFSASVQHSGTAHLLHSVTPQWNQSLRAHLERLAVGHLVH
jgi:membrane protein required for colicin V production